MQPDKTQKQLERLRLEHRALDAAVGQLSARAWLSDTERAHATDLKKRRLRARDRIHRIAARSARD